jgi:hypothetical protein
MTARDLFGALIFTIIATFNSISQNIESDLEFNRATLRFYSGLELIAFEEQEPETYNQLKYYFTQSFEVELLNCNTCAINVEEFYNLDVFNIANFEHLRLPNSTNSFVYREKYQITLLPLNVVQNEIGTTPESMLTKVISRPFPEWISTGNNQADFELYHQEVMDWANDFPEEYRAMTSNPELFSIRYEDFVSLAPERKNIVLTKPNGYLITK